VDNNIQFIIHYDEIGLKGKNREFFITKLIQNIRSILGSNFDVRKGTSKIIIIPKKQLKLENFTLIINKLKFIPGISNIAPAIECKTNMNEICRTALDLYNHYNPKTFKIEAVRAHKQFELTSPQISKQVGGFILKNNKNAKVDVHEPELLLKIELEKYKTFVLGKKETAIGGMPVGSAGHMLCLLSGGLDSPVAAFEMMKRGAKVDFVHFHNQTINKAGVESKIKKLVQELEKVQGTAKLHLVPFSDLQKKVIAHVPSDLRMIIYKRLMLKLADKLMQEHGYGAMITGDSLAQVASQTLENLQVIYQASNKLILSPLIGRNKSEIVEIAKQIGTYEISIEPYEDCCSLMIGKHPQTRAKLEDVLRVEKLIC